MEMKYKLLISLLIVLVVIPNASFALNENQNGKLSNQGYSNGKLSDHASDVESSIDYDGDGKLSVIVHYKEKPNFVDELYLYAKSADIKQNYKGISAIACELAPAEIEKLQSDDAVSFVESDAKVYAFDAEQTNMQTVGWGTFAVGAVEVQRGGNFGQDVKVGIIDTGIDYTHPDLSANYVGGYDFVNDDSDPMDDHGHGTHVSGIVGALNNNIGTLGVAPQVKLYAAKVLDNTGAGAISDVVAGLQYCVDNNIDVVCMSLGSRYNSPALCAACAYANENGIVLVTAAGNSGDGDESTIELSYPAAYDTTIAVGALDVNNLPASWSCSGPHITATAPGVGIVAPLPASGYYSSDTRYGELSGTSMAAPHVVGVVAQIIYEHPEYNVNEVKYVIEHTANDVYDSGYDDVTGWGLVASKPATEYVITATDPVPSPTSPTGSGEMLYWEYDGQSIDDWRRVGDIQNGTIFGVDGGVGFGSAVSQNQKVLERYVYFPGTQTNLKFWGQAKRGGEWSDWDYTMSIDGVQMASFKDSVDKWSEYSASVIGFPEGIHKISFMAQWRGETYDSNQKVGMQIDSVRLYANEPTPFSYMATDAILENMDIVSQSITTTKSDVGLLAWDDSYTIYEYNALDTMNNWYVESIPYYAGLYYSGSEFGYTGVNSIPGRTSIKGIGRIIDPDIEGDGDPGTVEKTYYFPAPSSGVPELVKIEFDTFTGYYADSPHGYEFWGAYKFGGVEVRPFDDGNMGSWVHTTIDTTDYAGIYTLQVYADADDDDSYSSPPYTIGAHAIICIDEVATYFEKVDPDFIVDVSEGSVPLTVEFHETTADNLLTVASGDYNYRNDRLWNFGDGTSSNDENPTHTYVSQGTYNVKLSNEYQFGDQVLETTKNDFVNVSKAGAITFDCNFTGTPTSGDSPLTVEFTGTCEGEGEITYIWDYGDGYTGYGQTNSHTYTTYGSNQTYSVALLTQNDVGTGTITRASYIEVYGSDAVAVGSGTYDPHQVRFLIVNQFGKPISNVSVIANAEETTGVWGWLTSWFGIPSDVDVQNTEMSGTTGSNGALVFTMIENIKYRLDIYAPATERRDAINTTVFLYPLESEHLITLIPDKILSSGEALDAELWSESVDADTVRVGLSYLDITDNTTRLKLVVSNTTVAEDGTVGYETLHTETLTNPVGAQQLSYDFDFVGGETLVWGYEIDHAIYGDDISKYQFIKIKSLRPVIDFAPWIPLDVYNWIAISLLICIAAIFSYLSLKFGAIVVPIFGGLLKFWGYLVVPWLIVSVAIALGILIYVRISESESDT